VSCGHENLVIWKVKNKFISNLPLKLNEHAKGTAFNDFDVLKKKLNKKSQGRMGVNTNCIFIIYFVSSRGYLYIVDYVSAEMKSVLKLHKSAINAVKISKKHHFFMTGGEDQFLKVWSLDSTELLYDFQLESQILSMATNSDDKIIVSTLNGSVGCVDLQNKMYKNLIRSHAGKILDVAYNARKTSVVTVSDDHTIRLWDLKLKMNQSYEFQCLDQMPTKVCSFHFNDYICVGFDSGMLRIFDIEDNIFL
jgi:WD40 repeat protein